MPDRVSLEEGPFESRAASALEELEEAMGVFEPPLPLEHDPERQETP